MQASGSGSAAPATNAQESEPVKAPDVSSDKAPAAPAVTPETPPRPAGPSEIPPPDSQESKNSQPADDHREAIANQITVKLHAIIDSEGNVLHVLNELT